MNDSSHGNRIVEILLIDDDQDDIELAREALDDIEVGHHLTAVENGVQAMAYLRAEGDFQHAIVPDLILLDLKMPKKNGLEVLAELKADEDLRRIPVIVLTSSDAPDDILNAYDLQASCYVTKPADLEEFERVMGLIKGFCLTIVRLPPRAARPAALSSR
jgi:two-component system response regulator